jgi:hypothetical protein
VPRATISFDVVGRQFDGGRGDDFALLPRQLPYVANVGGAVQTITVQEFRPKYTAADQTLLQAVVGGKVNPFRTTLVVVNVLFPLTDVGLRNKPALNIGLEYTF